MTGLVDDAAYDSPDWTALVRTIRANPACDLSRLVAADWLEERGNAARAGLIRTQCARPGKPVVGRPGAGLTATVRRPGESALLDTITPSITPAIPGASLTIDRGFVVAAELPWERWEEVGDWLLRREPVARVTLTTRPRYTLARLPRRRRVEHRIVAGMLAGRPVSRWDYVDAAVLSERWPDIPAAGWTIQDDRGDYTLIYENPSAHGQRPPRPEVQ